jgi:hypothetical protein
MSEQEDPTASPPLWANFVAGFGRHGIIGRVYIVLQSGLSLGLVAIVVRSAGAGPGLSLGLLAAAALNLGMVAGVALHKRAVITVAFVFSILGTLAAPFTPGASWALRGVTLALNLMYLWYFGRLQRPNLDAELTSGDEEPPQAPGAA